MINSVKAFGKNDSTEKPRDRFTRKKIQIDELGEELNRVLEGKTDFNFIGINANRYDCLYFVRNDRNFNLEFRALKKIQIPYLELLEQFAAIHNIKYESETIERIPYLSLKTNTTINDTVDLARRIQKGVFGNADQTIYTIVP